SSSVNAVTVSQDGAHIVSGDRDGKVLVWDLATGEGVCTLEGHSSSVNAVAVSPDGAHIVSGGKDQTVRVWDLATGEGVHTFKGCKKFYLMRNGRLLVDPNGWLMEPAILGTDLLKVLLWIPPACRGEIASSRGLVAIGTGDGRIVVIKVKGI